MNVYIYHSLGFSILLNAYLNDIGVPDPFPVLFTAGYTAPQKRGKTVFPVEKTPWKFSVLHKVIPYIPAVPLA